MLICEETKMCGGGMVLWCIIAYPFMISGYVKLKATNNSDGLLDREPSQPSLASSTHKSIITK